ncbi:RnfABCDGE type electron transport complex subunit G [Dethiothermospora halolimnae]|uniref:RnfABCDGE type electron transport complex subunit G n=1 Tax=Dethiothermospora halolimnae TaxID=3114390 RepID=UPI003CCBEFB7
MREIIKLGLILLLITSVAASILGLSNGLTEGKIEEVEAKASEEARKEVLPGTDSFKSIDDNKFKAIKDENDKILEVYKGMSDGSLAGYAIKTVTSGYGGDVEVITGISIEGKITGIKVVKHLETPGLGANATSADFQDQYKGISTDKEVVRVKTNPSKDNEIQALTGATITSDTVTDCVNMARELFNDRLNK